MAFEALEFAKRALALEHLQRNTVGSCPTICILHRRKGSKLLFPLTWCLLSSKSYFVHVLHDLAGIKNLDKLRFMAYSMNLLTLHILTNTVYNELWNKEKKKMVVETGIYNVSICHAPWLVVTEVLPLLKGLGYQFGSLQNNLYHKWDILKSWSVSYPWHATICLASDTGASPVFNSRWWHWRLAEEENTSPTNRTLCPRGVFYEKTGPASYWALQNYVTLLDHQAGYCWHLQWRDEGEVYERSSKHLSKAFIASTIIQKEISG